MKEKRCKHISFWDIYKAINFGRFFARKWWIKIKCNDCGKMYLVKWKWYKKIKRSFIKSFLTWFMWMLPAFILIYLVATQVLHYMLAIILITIFHFWAMFYIINSRKLKFIEK